MPAIPKHHTPTSDGAWDGPANEARLKTGGTQAYYRSFYSWQDAAKDPTTKAAYKGGHHEVSSDGTPGAADVKACVAVIAALNGARGGFDIPEADRKGVWAHAAAHLKDAGVDVPDLKGASRRPERKTFALKVEVKENPDDPADRTIEGWASTFGNTDSDNDVVMPGAFAGSIRGRNPKMLWQHDSKQPVGVWDAVKETPQGLYVKGRILDTTLGNDVYKLAKAGAIDSMSIGYSPTDWSMDYASGTRSLKSVDLWEVSLVTFPANEQAKVTMVKGAKSVMDDIGDAVTFLEQAMSLCDAYGEMQPTPELMATLHDLIDQAQDILTEDRVPDGDDDASLAASPKHLERHLREAGLTRAEARGLLAKGYTAIAPRREAVGGAAEIATLFNQFR